MKVFGDCSQWRWKCYSSWCFVAIIVFEIVIKVESVQYRTFDLREDGRGKISMRSDKDASTLSMNDNRRFSTRAGSLDIRGRYWSKTRRDPEYLEDQESASSSSDSFVTVNQDGEEIDESECETRPCIAFDRVDRKHTITFSLSPEASRKHSQMIKKFVVKPMIQYVIQYDKDSRGDEESSASSNYEEYEGARGQAKMKGKHEQNIDRFFNDINANFEGYWGNNDGSGNSVNEGQGGGYGSGGSVGGGYEGSNGGDSYQVNYNDGGGGVNFGFGFGSNGNGEGHQVPNNGNLQQTFDGFATAGVYGPPGTASGVGSSSGSTAPGSSAGYSSGMVMGGGGGMGGGSLGDGMSLSNAVQMSTSQQSDMQMSDMMRDSPGNAISTAMRNVAASGPQTGNNMQSAMGMPAVGMSQPTPGNGMANAAAVSSNGMGMMPSPPVQQMSMPGPVSPPGQMYGVPGVAPGQPLGPGEQFQQSHFNQGFSMGSGGNSMGMFSPQSMSMQMGPGPGGFGGSMPGFNQQMSAIVGGGGMGMVSGMPNFPIQPTGGHGMTTSSVQTSNGPGMTHSSGMMTGSGPSSSSGSNSIAPSTASANSGSSVGGGGADGTGSSHGPPNSIQDAIAIVSNSKGKKPSPSYGPPSSNESSDDDGAEESSKERERPPRPPRGKNKPGGGGKSKGRGGGRGRKSLFPSLRNFPKLPASIGGHLSFMFSTGFGKNRKGRGGSGSGGGGSKPGGEGKSRPIDKEQVSDHILNILGLTVHHPPRHSPNNNASSHSTNPIVLWEQQDNSTSFTQLASHNPGDTQEDIVAHLPLIEMHPKIQPQSSLEPIPSISANTEASPTEEAVPISTTVQPESIPTTSLPTTVVQNVTLEQAIAISSELNLSSTPSSPVPTTTFPPPSTPVFTTSPRPLIPAIPPKETRARFRFRKPKNLDISPQSEFFPAAISVFVTPPPPPNTKPQTAPSFTTDTPPTPSIPIVSAPTPYDPLQEYINYKLSNNLLTLDDPNLQISPSAAQTTPPQPTHRPSIDAYYAEHDYFANPIKLVHFDPWIYDALQAAFQPIDDGTYYTGLPEVNRKRKRRYSLNRSPQRIRFLFSVNDALLPRKKYISRGK